ncbi:MAG: peptidyl-prolyl cis-trans isomerase, partial [Anaerolineae bacterium]
MKRMIMAALAAAYVSLGYVPMSFARAEAPQAETVSDVIARVGDQSITFSEINTALNSSAIVGVSVPALGTPERDTVRITLLDRFVSANLLYLDARKQGLDKDPGYVREVERFDNAILADLYLQRQRSGEIAVSADEVQAYYDKNAVVGKELTPDLRAAIESKLRRDKVQQQRAEARRQVREGVEVVVHEDNLALAGDAERVDDVVLAEIDGEPVTWGAVKDTIIAAGKGAVIADPLAMEADARRQSLETVIDLRIMASRARAAGLDQDPVYRARAGEFHKTRLINLHRERLVEQIAPTDAELKAFYEANKASIVVPEARKVQMVVLKTQEEAEQIKARIDAGELTMYQAAQQYSIAAKAKDDLGEVGWVFQG